MSRTQKEKLETYPEISLQVISKTSTEDNAVTSAGNYNFDSTQEKRRKEADEPLYLKRV